MVEYPDGEVQCVLCGRLVAEWQASALHFDATYPGDARGAADLALHGMWRSPAGEWRPAGRGARGRVAAFT